MDLMELKDVSYRYRNSGQGVEILKGISCGFGLGKVYGIVGKSGSGKSTALTLMAGLDLPERGDILYEGISTRNMDLNLYRRTKAAVIYQSFQLFPLLTALENVMYPMELNGMKRKEARLQAGEYIRKVGLNEEAFHRFPSRLSGGEQQRIAIARALAMQTKLLLADEPTGNLDSANTGNIMDILTRLAHEDGYCVVIVTHDLGLLDQMDCVLRMKDGLLEACEEAPEGFVI